MTRRDVYPQTPSGFALREAAHRVLLIVWPPHPSEEEISAYLTHGLTYFQEGPYAAVHSAPSAGFVAAVSRSRIGAFVRENRRVFEENCKASALASESAIVRGYFTAIRWVVNPSAYPMETFSNVDIAIRWAETQLRERL